MIKPGDYVVLTGKEWQDIQGYYGKIKQIKEISTNGLRIVFMDDEHVWPFNRDGWEIQHIQDYFQPGDEVLHTYEDPTENRVLTVKEWKSSCVLRFTNGSFTDFTARWNIKEIRNLTKEKQEKEANMPKEKPTHLTAKELFEVDACDTGFIKFVTVFGKRAALTDKELKEWFESHKEYKTWLQGHLPDHYAVIFPEWQPTINEIVWYINRPQIIGRVYKIKNRWMDILWQSDDKLKAFNISDIKPISERPFQVGDWVELTIEYNGQKQIMQLETQEQAKYANARKKWHKLIISPAIPEVK